MNERGGVGHWYVFFAIILLLLGALYLWAPGGMQTPILAIMGSVVLMVIVFSYVEFGRTTIRLHNKIERVKKLLSEESVDKLKEHYLKIHKHYLKLPDKHKPKFFQRIHDLREHIEQHLSTEKTIAKIFDTLGKNIQDQKQDYLRIYEHYQKLPTKSKEKFYPQLTALKQKLEGRK